MGLPGTTPGSGVFGGVGVGSGALGCGFPGSGEAAARRLKLWIVLWLIALSLTFPTSYNVPTRAQVTRADPCREAAAMASHFRLICRRRLMVGWVPQRSVRA